MAIFPRCGVNANSVQSQVNPADVVVLFMVLLMDPNHLNSIIKLALNEAE